jgi:hypothetical protein
MGVGYYTNVTEWSKGEYPYATNSQDEFRLIGNKLSYRDDDRGNTPASASQLLVENDGSIVSSNPQSDPGNIDPNNKGVIETRVDIDMFYFDAAGAIDINVTPAWAAFTRSGTGSDMRGANLDIQATLYDQNGRQITTNDPNNNTNAKISTTLGAGRYYLAIAGLGNTSTAYSDYGSGRILYSRPITLVAIPNAPSSLSATALTGRRIQLHWTDTSNNETSFLVQRSTNGGRNWTWSPRLAQNTTNYTNSGLTAGWTYTYRVGASNSVGTTYSKNATAIVIN